MIMEGLTPAYGAQIPCMYWVAAAVVKAAVAVAEATPPAEETGAGVWVPTTKAVKVEPASVAVEKTT